MSQTRVVVITGAPGVGKTTAARSLVRWAPPATAFVEVDMLACLRPFTVDERFYRVVTANLVACVSNFRSAGITEIVLDGVFAPNGIYDRMSGLLEDPAFDWRFFVLRATPAVLATRIRGDQVHDSQFRLQWTHLDATIAGIPGARLIATDLCSPVDVAREIAVAAGWVHTATP